MKKSAIRILSLALCLALCLAALPSFASAADKQITDIHVKVGEPALGDSPGYRVATESGTGWYSAQNNDGIYRNDVYWRNVTDNVPMQPGVDYFEDGKVYAIYIYLTVMDGYTCSKSTIDSVDCTLNGRKANKKMYGDQIQVSYEFPALPAAKKVTEVSVEVTPPKAGEKPSYTPNFPAGAGYTYQNTSNANVRNGILWYNSDGELKPGSGVFEEGKSYTLRVYLKEKDGYYFPEVSSAMEIKLNRSSATLYRRTESDGKYAYVETSYYLRPLEEIESVSVTAAHPKAGNSPRYSVSVSRGCEIDADSDRGVLRNDISWYNVTDDVDMWPDEDVFEVGKVYRITVYLTMEEGYTFTRSKVSSKPCELNGNKAKLSASGDQLCVEYTFPAVKKPINSVEVGIEAPAAGKLPSYELKLPSGANYSVLLKGDGKTLFNGVRWMNSGQTLLKRDTPFQADEQYIVLGILVAKDGYEFADREKIALTFKGSAKAECYVSEEEDGTPTLVVVALYDSSASAGKWGDVNGDGKADSDDAMLILRYDVKKIGAEKLKNFAMADVDGSGVVDSDDAMLILRYDVKKIAKFPVEK